MRLGTDLRGSPARSKVSCGGRSARASRSSTGASASPRARAGGTSCFSRASSSSAARPTWCCPTGGVDSRDELPSPPNRPEVLDAPRIMAILFADAVQFSKLTESQIPRFVEHFLGAIGKLAEEAEFAPVARNTWGDGLYFVFSGVGEA